MFECESDNEASAPDPLADILDVVLPTSAVQVRGSFPDLLSEGWWEADPPPDHAEEAAVDDAALLDPSAWEQVFGPVLGGRPGPLSASAVAELPIAEVRDDRLLDAITARARLEAWNRAGLAMLICELARRRARTAVGELTGRKARGESSLPLGARAVIDEVALELSLSRIRAERLVDTAIGWWLDCPQTLDALARGDVDASMAEMILEQVQRLVVAQADAEAAAAEVDAGGDSDAKTVAQKADRTDPEGLGRALETELLGKAEGRTVAQVRRIARRALIDVDAAAARRRHARAKTRRNFSLQPDDDSMARLSAYLPADEGMAVQHALTRLAHHLRGPDDTRTLDQLRVDALVQAVVGAADALRHERCPQHDAETHASGAETPNGHASRARTPEERTRGRSTPENGAPGGSTPGSTATGSPTDEGLAPRWEGDGEAGNDWDDVPPAHPERAAATSPPASGCGDGSAGAICDRVCPGCRPSSARRGRGSGRRDPRVTVTMSLETLLGLDDRAADLHGYGPIVAGMARQVAAEGTWRCAITDGTHGTLLGLGASTYSPGYRPTQALRRHVIVRDQTCRVPGCSTRADLCDVDHCAPWPEGATCECGVEALCGHHHRLKHESGFDLVPSADPADPPGTLYWITPAGRRRASHPPAIHPPPAEQAPAPLPAPADVLRTKSGQG
jgi:Domain of unknown function (DUF222)